MKKLLLVALTLALVLPWAETAAAQTQRYGTEVCVNASNADEARQLFPTASVHIIRDFADGDMNGWRIVSGPVGAGGKIMTDAQEIQLRRQESRRDVNRNAN
ncbi:MAG: hypothetical protein HYY45_01205 [Deltaproteobacteria bacterium]|nr:hypothetical protein [Deltaproteobacteria bacterium]